MIQAFLVALISLVLSTGVQAQQANNDQTAQALARAQSLLRQLAQEKATVDAEVAKLRAENAKLGKEGKKTKADLEGVTADLASASRETTTVRASLGRTEQRVEKLTAQLKDVIAKYKEKALTLRQTEAEREDLKSKLAATEVQLADSEKKNLALYRANKDILAEFEKEGSWDGFLRKEPVTGIKRVEIENIVQEYEYKMLDQVRDSNLKAATDPAAAAPAKP